MLVRTALIATVLALLSILLLDGPLAVLPVLISLARFTVNHHHLSDVIASVAVAAFVVWAFAKKLFRCVPEN